MITGLTNVDAARLDSSRSKLLDLKIVILGRLRHAARSRDAHSLWSDCLEALSRDLDAEEVDSLLRIDGVYRSFKEILPAYNPRMVSLVPDTGGLVTGGLTQLLWVIGHFEQEITIGTYSRVKEALEPDLVPTRRARPQFYADFLHPPYFEFARYGKLPKLDAALDLFLNLESKASDFWQSYQSRVNDALANAFYENVAIKKRVKRSLASKFVPVVDTFANWLYASLEAGGAIPQLNLSVPIQSTLSEQHIFRRDGDDWTVRYEGGKLLALPHSVGIFYLGYLINHPGKKFTASELRRLHQQQHSGPSDAVYGKMDEQELGREGLSGWHRLGVGPVVDERGLEEIKERLTKIEEGLESAISAHDDANQGRLEAEKEALIKEVRDAVGLGAKGEVKSGGKHRQVDLGAKKNRDAVRNAINREFEKIEKKHLPLGRHLRNSLQFQDLFFYEPDHPVAWNS